ncbi:cytochrome P450 [Actinomadura fulvescens]|uniref:Cytochrome P450 n=1 Tax=Actinomadura fulvescens TaxID=46160 RepID=A0ABN3PY42_9ACTN
MMTITRTPGEIKALPSNPVRDYLRHPALYRTDRVGLFQEVFRTCGDLGTFRVGRRTYYLASSVELAHQLLVKNGAMLDKPRRFQVAMGPLLGDGLLAASNEVHAVQRKLIQPKFRKKTLLSTSAEVAATYSREAADRWADGEVIDVYAQMMRLVMLIVAKDVFGRSVHEDASDFGTALNEAIAEFNTGVSALAQFTAMLPSRSRRRYLRAIAAMNRTFYRMLEEHRTDPDPPDDWLTALLECRYDDGSPMSDVQIRDEAINLLMAGNETTGAGLTWTCHLLSRHPAVYDRLLDEVRDVLAGRTVTVDDLPKLPYTLQVFKESMRLYPPVYMFSRQPAQDVTACGHTIPAGAAILFSPYVLHHRADYFPDPERFDPDRFSPERERDIPTHAYMPFASGHRICIGNNHALLNGQIALATLSQRVRFSAIPGQEVALEPKLTLRPRGGLKLKVQRLPE